MLQKSGFYKIAFMPIAIRHLGIGEILDQAVKLIKADFGVLFATTAVMLIPYDIASRFIVRDFIVAPPPNPTFGEMLAVLKGDFQILLARFGVIGCLILPLTNAALVHCISNRYLGQPCGLRQTLRYLFQRFFGLFGTWLLFLLVVTCGLVLCIVPGFLIVFRYGLSTQVVAVEGISGFAALQRSRNLIGGNVASLVILSAVLIFIGSSIHWSIDYIPNESLHTVGSALAGSIMTVLWSAVIVVFYFSCRCKMEQFDLELLARSVGDEVAISPVRGEDSVT